MEPITTVMSRITGRRKRELASFSAKDMAASAAGFQPFASNA